ncbi:MAG: hypothetical protein JNK61_00820 [Bacteroidia bacterium]|nr:hypothetical protein [Bacteroidia bacterium]
MTLKYYYNNYTAFIITFAVVLLMHDSFLFFSNKPAPTLNYICIFGFTYIAYSNFKQYVYKLKPAGLIGLTIAYLLICYICFKQIWAVLIMLLVAALVYAYQQPAYKNQFALRQIPFGKTITLALVWSLITVALPATYITYVSTTTITLVFLRRMIFLAAMSLPFDLRDVNTDTSISYFNTVNHLGSYKAKFICMSLLVLNLLLLLILFGTPTDFYLASLYFLAFTAAYPCYLYFKNQNTWYLLWLDVCLLVESVLLWGIYQSNHRFIF